MLFRVTQVWGLYWLEEQHLSVVGLGFHIADHSSALFYTAVKWVKCLSSGVVGISALLCVLVTQQSQSPPGTVSLKQTLAAAKSPHGNALGNCSSLRDPWVGNSPKEVSW